MIASTLTRLVQRYDRRAFRASTLLWAKTADRDAQIHDIDLKDGRETINEANVDSPWTPKPYGDEPFLPNSLVQPSEMQRNSMSRREDSRGRAAA